MKDTLHLSQRSDKYTCTKIRMALKGIQQSRSKKKKNNKKRDSAPLGKTIYSTVNKLIRIPESPPLPN